MRTDRGSRRFLTPSCLLGVAALLAATLTPHSGSAASQEKVLYSFCAIAAGFYCIDGDFPRAGLIQDDSGNFYGTTEDGGAGGAGTVFELTPNKTKTAWAHKALYHFCAQGGNNCTDGAFPVAGLVRDPSGHLYGTTEEGGAVNDGTVFELMPPTAGQTAWKHKVLYNFCEQLDCTDGESPRAGLIQDASGNLYGTTTDGGANDEGTVFELMPPPAGEVAWTEVVLYSFCAQPSCTDGASPEARLIRDALSGNLFGTTEAGGANSEGTAFELMPPPTGQTAWTETVLYSFCSQSNCADGEEPVARLTRDPTGHLFGTTEDGGAFHEGTVFELTPPPTGQTLWTEVVLHSFCARGGEDCTDGSFPRAGLTRDPAGNLYGTTEDGGADGGGTLFALTPPAAGKHAWKETVLYSFCGQVNCKDGSSPEADLFRDASGHLYGTTSAGGVNGTVCDGGTVFELDTSVALAELRGGNPAEQPARQFDQSVICEVESAAIEGGAHRGASADGAMPEPARKP